MRAQAIQDDFGIVSRGMLLRGLLPTPPKPPVVPAPRVAVAKPPPARAAVAPELAAAASARLVQKVRANAGALAAIEAIRQAGTTRLADIACALTLAGIETPGGGQLWLGNTVRRLLEAQKEAAHIIATLPPRPPAKPEFPAERTVHGVAMICADVMGMDVKWLRRPTKERGGSLGRFVAFVAVRRWTGREWPVIAQYFRRERTTAQGGARSLHRQIFAGDETAVGLFNAVDAACREAFPDVEPIENWWRCGKYPARRAGWGTP